MAKQRIALLLTGIISFGFFSQIAFGQTFSLPAKGSIEVAFSPNEGSEDLVMKANGELTQVYLGVAN